jgi:hypothetical protein
VNIFAVHTHPGVAARSLPDKLVVKMPTESLQLLTPWAYNTNGFLTFKPDETPYSIKGYAHHPCMKWQYESPANVAWLLRHSLEMCNEYFVRYAKGHGQVHGALHGLSQVMEMFTEHYGTDVFWVDHTPFVLAMPEQYRNPDNPIQSYRDYLINEKGYAVWKHHNEPDWWDHEAHRPARERYLAEKEEKRIKRANAKHQGIQGSVQSGRGVRVPAVL